MKNLRTRPEDKDNRIFLFVRCDKNDKDGTKNFYFLDEIEVRGI